MEITILVNGRSFTASFIKSEDAGYDKGSLILDVPGGHISIYRVGHKWIEAFIENKVCRRSKEHATRQEALNSAAEEFAGATMDAAAFTD